MRRLPFEEWVNEEGIRRRVFARDTIEDELVWHRDRSDREVLIREGTGWYLQLDDELPVPLMTGSVYQIEAGQWHRVIRTEGCTRLIVDIKET
jgi:quercetin dioxygenase-like cupin family protein